MNKLQRTDLYSLEQYARQRQEFRNMVMEHKKNRRVAIGANANLYFEDRITMHYQIQEILRTEKIFEDDAIAEELAVYNALIPDGCNWKATFMLEYSEVSERVQCLQKLVGVEHMVWIKVGGEKTITAIADEDLERSTEDKTSAVHFLRFELDQQSRSALKDGAPLAVGIDHVAYKHRVEQLPQLVRDSLAMDIGL